MKVSLTPHPDRTTGGAGDDVPTPEFVKQYEKYGAAHGRGGSGATGPNSKKRRSGVPWPIFAASLLVIALIAFAGGTRWVDAFQTASGTALDYSLLDEVYAKLRESYNGEIDREALVQGAAAGMAAGLGDPYTEYFSPQGSLEYDDALNGRLQGIGVSLDPAAKPPTVLSVIKDTPAERAGLLAGDEIVAIDDEDSSGLSADQAVTRIRGDAGTEVKLTVLRDGELNDYTIERAEITAPSVNWEVIDGDLGYIQISQFSEDTAGLARQAAQELLDQGVKGFILDLRGNGGGYVNAASSVAGMWITSGEEIVQERTNSGRVLDTARSTGANILEGRPTVVLVDGGSASASEIVAGALRDQVGIKLVGQTTYGKGVVQELVPIGTSGATLKVTVANWYTPNGDNISQKGLVPDREVELTREQLTAGQDPQKDAAIEVVRGEIGQ